MSLSLVSVKIWDTVGEDQILKAEHRAISGRMCVSCTALLCQLTHTVHSNDIDWDMENKRLIAVGDSAGKCVLSAKFAMMACFLTVGGAGLDMHSC
jgi:hypothetical protein